MDPVSDEYRRRTWAVIYCLEKVLSVAFGRPASVPDAQMTGREPVPDLSTTASIGPQGNVDLPGDFLAVSFKPYQVMARSLANRYGANLENAESFPGDITSLKFSGELRQMLQGWAASLPPYLHLCEPGSSVLSQNAPGIGFVSFSRLGIIILPFSYINRYLVPQYVICSRDI